MENIVFRRATLDDVEGIRAIGDVYDGLDDHMPKFSMYVQRPEYLCFVMEEKSHIIGFQMRHFLDNDIIVKKAERIHHEHRGRGLATPFHKYVERQVAAAYKTPRSKLVYTTEDSTISLARIVKQGHHVLPVDLKYIIYQGTPTSFNNILNSRQDSVRHISTVKEVHQLLRSDENRAKLFPSGWMVVSWTPYTYTEKNIQEIMKQSQVFVSFQNVDSEQLPVSVKVQAKERQDASAKMAGVAEGSDDLLSRSKDISAMSFVGLGTSSGMLRDVRVDIDVYVKPSPDVDADEILADHVSSCVRYIGSQNISTEANLFVLVYVESQRCNLNGIAAEFTACGMRKLREEEKLLVVDYTHKE